MALEQSTHPFLKATTKKEGTRLEYYKDTGAVTIICIGVGLWTGGWHMARVLKASGYYSWEGAKLILKPVKYIIPSRLTADNDYSYLKHIFPPRYN